MRQSTSGDRPPFVAKTHPLPPRGYPGSWGAVRRVPNTNMLLDYAPILVLVVMVLGFGIGNLVLSDLLGKKRRSIGKGDAYESGMTPVGDARLRLSIHFYLVAVLFILFDVESIFLIPWAVAAKELAELGMGGMVLVEVIVFAVVLAVGLAYVWRKGGLEWDR